MLQAEVAQYLSYCCGFLCIRKVVWSLGNAPLEVSISLFFPSVSQDTSPQDSSGLAPAGETRGGLWGSTGWLQTDRSPAGNKGLLKGAGACSTESTQRGSGWEEENG